MLPYYPSPHDLLLQQCCTQNGKRSIKGSLLTSRFCKCYGLVNIRDHSRSSSIVDVIPTSTDFTKEKMKISERVSKERQLERTRKRETLHV